MSPYDKFVIEYFFKSLFVCLLKSQTNGSYFIIYKSIVVVPTHLGTFD